MQINQPEPASFDLELFIFKAYELIYCIVS